MLTLVVLQMVLPKEAFDAAVSKLASLAYDDQCTPANPRQPYISELKLIVD